MNKSELISAMAAEAQMSKADAKKALDAFIFSVTNAMKAADKVLILLQRRLLLFLQRK